MSAEPVTLLVAWEIYRKTILLPKKTQSMAVDEANWRRHINGQLGHFPMKNIRSQHIAFLRAILEGKNLSPQTVKHCLGLIRRIMKRALEWEMYGGPLPIFRMPAFDNRRLRFLSAEEAISLFAELKRKSNLWHDISVFALYTGLRVGEIFKLTSADVDVKNATVHVLGKNSKHRAVPLNKEALDIVQKYLGQTGTPSGILFQSEEGKPNINQKIFQKP